MKKLYKLGAIMTALFMVGFVALTTNAQPSSVDKEVQVQILGDELNCTFQDYELMQTGFSYAEQVLNSNITGYVCTMEAGGTDEYVGVESHVLNNSALDVTQQAAHNIPAEDVKIKHETMPNVASGFGSCELSGEVLTNYVDVSTQKDLFNKDDYTVCTVEGTTQLEVTVPAALPVGTYTGDLTFRIYGS